MTPLKNLHYLLFDFSQQSQIELNSKCNSNCLVTFKKMLAEVGFLKGVKKELQGTIFFPKKEISWKVKNFG